MSNSPPPLVGHSPYARVLGIEQLEREGREMIVMHPGDHLVGRPAFLHGGAISGLVENAAWFMLRDVLGDVVFKPISVTVEFLRGGKLVDTFAAARCTRLGRKLAFVEAWGWQDDEASPIVRADLKYLIVR
ncbi:PaaI family thioesterase [Sphingomonas sp.]|uniref:PaaI family thioesterase n=1 Tax=Sphingomonas sp. TaxID=28214 RepID=UPI0025E79EF2|nr:PaaI family thioesterase [Sphingomonas sp.]